MLTKNQFDILSAIAEGCPCESVQSGADSTFLTENGYISDGKITDTGFAALEPYRVKRAICCRMRTCLRPTSCCITRSSSRAISTTPTIWIPMKRSDDWCFRVDEHDVIQEVMVGGEDCMQMVGISYWTAEDGQRLARHLVEAFNAPGEVSAIGTPCR